MSDFNDALAAAGFDAADIKGSFEEPKKLEGTAETLAAGTFVLQGQQLATEEGFRNVSKIWYNKTVSFEDGMEALEKGRALTEDINARVSEMVPAVNDAGTLVFRHLPSSRDFIPTEHAWGQIGLWSTVGTTYLNMILTNPTDYKGREKFARDRQDMETLAIVLRNGFRRADEKKNFLWRTRKDGTLRAMLTDRFAIVDNRWYLEKLKEMLPGGRLSHWRGDSDTIFGNVLIPDTIRADEDSEYGGMLSIGNSEIGERRLSSLPSIFRAICMNGCIWGQVKGKDGINQVHRGRIDLPWLEKEIRSNLDKQIPLLPTGIDKLLGLRNYGWDGDSVKPVFAAVANLYKLQKREAAGLLMGYAEEIRETPAWEKTGFSFVNAVTRAGQKMDNKAWVNFDTIGGEMVGWDMSDFGKLFSRAKSMSVAEVDKAFAA